MVTPDPLITGLRNRRIELGLSQAQLGARLRWRYNRISHLESGRASPTLYTLRLWAAALDIEITGVPRLLEKRRTGYAPWQLCGTASAAKRHRKHGEPVDAACLAAEREYNNARNRRRRARRAEQAAA